MNIVTAVKELLISDDRKISAIQKDFNELFPFLKLEFFNKPHAQFGLSPKRSMISASKNLGECRTLHNAGTISISSATTVVELEQSFSSIYGISVQVFRHSGKLWLETSVTDSWTLEKQNAEGEALSKNEEE